MQTKGGGRRRRELEGEEEGGDQGAVGRRGGRPKREDEGTNGAGDQGRKCGRGGAEHLLSDAHIADHLSSTRTQYLAAVARERRTPTHWL
jgi:hypothetical protein